MQCSRDAGNHNRRDLETKRHGHTKMHQYIDVKTQRRRNLETKQIKRKGKDMMLDRHAMLQKRKESETFRRELRTQKRN